MRNYAKGFTLVELLIVIGIIGVLAALIFPVYPRVREHARSLGCRSNLNQLGLALDQFVRENNGKLPLTGAPNYSPSLLIWSGNLQKPVCMGVLIDYLANDPSIFLCPSRNASNPSEENGIQNWGTGNNVNSSYLYRGAKSPWFEETLYETSERNSEWKAIIMDFNRAATDQYCHPNKGGWVHILYWNGKSKSKFKVEKVKNEDNELTFLFRDTDDVAVQLADVERVWRNADSKFESSD